MKTRILGLSIVVILLLAACKPGNTATPVPYTSSPAPTSSSTTVSGPMSTWLMDLKPSLEYGGLLIFGEDSLIEQQYGDFHKHGNYYPHSIFAPAPSVLLYDLNGKYDSFTTTVMLDDGPGMDCPGANPDGAFFVIEADGEVVFRSPQMFYNTPPMEVSLDVTGVQSLRLEVYSTTNIGVNDNNSDCDASIWGDPSLVTENTVASPAIHLAPITSPTINTSPASEESMVDLYVSPQGSDRNPGTLERPFATLQHTRDVIRTINQDMNGPIQVFLREGTYPITETLAFTQQDSGTNGFPIIYQAYQGEVPVISGGVQVSGWEPVSGEPYWHLQVPATIQPFRNLYVNGQRAVRAQTEKTVLGVGWWQGDWSDRDGIFIDPQAPGWWLSDWQGTPGIEKIMNSGDLPTFSRPQDLEVHWNYEWFDILLGNRLYVISVGTIGRNPEEITTIQAGTGHSTWKMPSS
jgi:hypothetical protein